jgi:DNA-binding response OmpR family regulator
MNGARLLLVEDDRDLASGLADALDLEGYRVSHAVDGPSGLAQALSGRHDLVILDVMLPGLSGFDVLRQMRARGCDRPVLMLTARGQEVDKVRGLKLGADDYLTKPFGIMELLARIEARLRRARGAHPERLEVGAVVVDFRAREASRRGRPVGLTAREFDILELLAERRGEAVSRSDLVGRIWGSSAGDPTTRTVDQHVASLRRKLGDDAGEPRLIETVYGYGYRLSLKA